MVSVMRLNINLLNKIVDFFIYDKKDFISKNIFKKLIYLFF